MKKSLWESDHRTMLSNNYLSERSTSAPPPETSLFFGSGDSGNGYLGSNRTDDMHLNILYENRNRRSPGIDSNVFFGSNKNDNGGRDNLSSSFDNPPPGFSSGLFPSQDSPDAVLSSSYSGSSRLGSLDKRAVGESLIRSQSAAPSYDSRLTMGPPPGLANSDTPLVSNTSRVTPGIDSYLQSTMDNSRILQLGERRSASTGVIGGIQSSSPAVLNSLGLSGQAGGAVRPAAKTLMDLIQEDFPPESPDGFGGDYERDDIYMDRPRTTSPLPLSMRDQYTYTEQPSGGGLKEALDRLQIKPHQNESFGAANQARPSPQFGVADHDGRPSPDGRVQGTMYSPVATQHVNGQYTVLQGMHQPVQFGHHQQPGYGTPQQPNVQPQGHPHQQPPIHHQVQTQVLPSGHTIYVTNPSHPYGYAAVQYSQHAQQQHIVHQTVQGGGPGEQYISVVPIHGGQVPGNTYAYWQPDGQQGGPQTVTILNSHRPNGIPMAVAGVGKKNEPQRQQQSHNNAGRGGREKSGKQKRGGNGGRRGGGDSKRQFGSATNPLLDEFKSKKNRDWTCKDIKGHVVEFCQDQNGSRFIQQRLEVGGSAEQQLVMLEVLPAVRRLRNDVFGNYVVQKLLDFGTPKVKSELRDTLQGEMLQLSLQMYGCRVVQKALETLDESDLPRLLTEFHNNVLSCIHDQNGNHVIQKCIEVMSTKANDAALDGDKESGQFFSEQIDFIVDDVLGNVASLSCHPYGCRVLQRILEHCVEPRKGRALDEIAKCHKALFDDQYGNYVIQHVLQFGRHDDRESILKIVSESGLLSLSKQKFASNVVEKLLKYGTAQQRKAVVRELLKVVDDDSGDILPAGSEGTSVVLHMVRDPYANYVVQTTLDVICESEEKRMLMEELNAHAAELKTYTFAKHIVTKLGA